MCFCCGSPLLIIFCNLQGMGCADIFASQNDVVATCDSAAGFSPANVRPFVAHRSVQDAQMIYEAGMQFLRQHLQLSAICTRTACLPVEV